MKIQGAVLLECGRTTPFADSLPIEVQSLDLSDPGPGEVLIMMDAAGVCHSDLSVVNGDRLRPVPMLLGHEACGRVTKTGPGVEDLRVGQRVVTVFLPRCGGCEACAGTGRNLCIPGSAANAEGTLLNDGRHLAHDGQEVFHHAGVSGFATAAVLHRSSVVAIPDDVPAHVGALFGCAVLTGGGAVKNAGQLKPGEDVIVVGAGGVGVAAALVAAALGAAQVTVVDALESKLEAVRDIGFERTFTPTALETSGHRAPLVIEATGHPKGFETAVAATAPGGRTVAVGLAAPSARSSISPLALVAESRTIIGSYLGSGDPTVDIHAYIELWRAGRLPVERLISSTIRLEDINHAMDELAAGRALRQLISLS
jgi:alcohol dehydrogenase